MCDWGEWRNYKGNIKRESERETGCLSRSNGRSHSLFDDHVMMVVDNLHRNEFSKRQRIIMSYEWDKHPGETQQWKVNKYNRGVIYDYSDEDYARLFISLDVYSYVVRSIKQMVARELRKEYAGVISRRMGMMDKGAFYNPDNNLNNDRLKVD